MNLSWKAAGDKDLDLLAEMNKELIEDEGSSNPMNTAELRERMEQLLGLGWQADLLCLDGEVVGYALYQFTGVSSTMSGRDVYLRQFFVRRDWRRQGLGQAGVRLLRSERLRGAETITLDVLETNPAGRRFWQQAGFVPYCVTMKLRGRVD